MVNSTSRLNSVLFNSSSARPPISRTTQHASTVNTSDTLFLIVLYSPSILVISLSTLPFHLPRRQVGNGNKSRPDTRAGWKQCGKTHFSNRSSYLFRLSAYAPSITVTKNTVVITTIPFNINHRSIPEPRKARRKRLQSDFAPHGHIVEPSIGTHFSLVGAASRVKVVVEVGSTLIRQTLDSQST